MIPLVQMPGYAQWGHALHALLAVDAPVWIYGEPGCGVSHVTAWFGHQRGTLVQDDADLMDAPSLEAWIRSHPRGVLGSHRSPEALAAAAGAFRCIPLRLPSLDDHPECILPCLRSMAEEEDVPEPLPPALSMLPCPGNLRGLRNRLVRWKLLEQLPDEASMGRSAGPLPLDSEDMATNLHMLERLLLHRALRRSYGNRVEAARRLGVSRRQLYMLIARHGDPVRGEAPTSEGPKRLEKQRARQNSSQDRGHR